MTCFLFRFLSQRRNPSLDPGLSIRPQPCERTFGGRKRSLVDLHHVRIDLALPRAPGEEMMRERVGQQPADRRPSSSSRTAEALQHRILHWTASSRERLERNGAPHQARQPTARAKFSDPVTWEALEPVVPLAESARRAGAADLVEGIAKQ